MIKIVEDSQYLKNHVIKINKKIVDHNSPSIRLDQIVQKLGELSPQLNELQSVINDVNSIDAKTLATLITVLYTQYLNPQTEATQAQQLQLKITTILRISLNLLKIPHDRDSVIKNIKKPQNSNTQIGNKNSKKNMNKIDAIFVLAICWQYGNRIQNIQLVQLMLDTYAFQLLIAQKINSSALVINNWKKYIQNLNKNKTTLNRIYSVLKSLQVPIHQQQAMPSHIYIPL